MNTFGVITYNRVDALRRSLKKLMEVADAQDEIIVVNNASTDGTKQTLADEFPSVTVLTLPSNIGTAARNEYFTKAHGEIVWTLDDDTFPQSHATVDAVQEVFAVRPDIGALCLNFFVQHDAGVSFPQFIKHRTGEQVARWKAYAEKGDDGEGYEGVFVNGGGMVARREVLPLLPGYDPDLFWGNEEADFALQLWRANCKILFLPHVYVVHEPSQENRNPVLAYELRVRNTILIFYKHFSFVIATLFSVIFILRRLLAVVVHPKKFIVLVRGIRSALRMLPKFRRKLSKLTVKDAWRLRRWCLQTLSA